MNGPAETTVVSWSTWREMAAVLTQPQHLRTVIVALTVGTVFFAMNQLSVVLAGRATPLIWFKVALTYATPFCVSSIGVLSATRGRREDRRPNVQGGRIAVKAMCAKLMTLLLIMGLAIPAQAAPVTANVYRFADGSQVLGAWSTLQTGDEGAHLTIHTSDLPAGNTVTVWWVIFNRPAKCAHPTPYSACGPGDLPPFGGDDSAETSLVYAAGHQIGGSGRGNFGAFLPADDNDDALWGPGLTNPLGAEIHLVVRDHGELTPQQRAEGIHNFGPCNPCDDLQFSVHAQ